MKERGGVSEETLQSLEQSRLPAHVPHMQRVHSHGTLAHGIIPGRRMQWVLSCTGRSHYCMFAYAGTACNSRSPSLSLTDCLLVVSVVVPRGESPGHPIDTIGGAHQRTAGPEDRSLGTKENKLSRDQDGD